MRLATCCCLLLPAVLVADEPPNADMINALRPFARFVGSWKGSGTSEKSAGWKESAECSWGFRKKDGRASLNFFVEGGAILKEGVLSYDPAEKKFRFSARKKDGAVMRFEGKALDETTLRLDRADENATDKLDRLELKLLRGGDKLMFAFRKKRGRSSFDEYASIEHFRAGLPESSADNFTKGPFCVVTGGPGRLEVEVAGKKVNVADEACKEELLANPKRYEEKIKD